MHQTGEQRGDAATQATGIVADAFRTRS